MTRKRFIKLLMSQGAQRNNAEKYARENIKIIPNYDYLYIHELLLLTEAVIENLEKILEEFRRNCFSDSTPHRSPQLLRKQFQLKEESGIKNDLEKTIDRL